MNRFFLFCLTVIFLFVATPANAQTVKGGDGYAVGPMRCGKGPTKKELAMAEAYAKLYPLGTPFVCSGHVDSSNFEVHDDAAEGGLEGWRCSVVCTHLASEGYPCKVQKIGMTEAQILKGLSAQSRKIFLDSQDDCTKGSTGFRVAMLFQRDFRCTEKDLKEAYLIYDKIHRVVRHKSDFLVFDRKLPVGYEEVAVEISFKTSDKEEEEEFGLKIIKERERNSTKKCYLAARKGATARTADKTPPRVDPPVVQEICDNGVDDDNNGKIDCADPHCLKHAAHCGKENTSKRCSDTIDNDGDGLVDCADRDCDPICNPEPEPGKGNSGEPTPTKERNCSDGIDNDKDGLTDCEDPDCQGILSSCSKFRFFGTIELRGGILDKSASGPFQGVSEVTDQIRTSDMFNGALTVGAYYPVKNGWLVGLEIGGVTATNLYALMGETTLRGNVHQKKFLVRGGVLKQLNDDFAVGFQLGSYLDGDGYVPVGRLSLQISLTKNLKFEVSAAVENTRHVQSHDNVWIPQIGVGLIYWF